MQTKIAEYETEVQRLKAEQAEITKSYALKDALTKEGALPDYIDLLLPTFKDLQLSEDGSLQGLAEALEGIKTSKPALFQQPIQNRQKHQTSHWVERLKVQAARNRMFLKQRYKNLFNRRVI